MLITLVLLAGAQEALLARRRALAGIFVGLAILLKPVPWPVVVLSALRRDWRTWGVCLATITVGSLASGLVVGPSAIVDYFTRALPDIAEAYQATPLNISAWAIGWRIFDGSGSPVQIAGQTPGPYDTGLLPFALALVTLVPTIALAAMMLLLARLPQSSSLRSKMRPEPL